MPFYGGDLSRAEMELSVRMTTPSQGNSNTQQCDISAFKGPTAREGA